MHACIDILPRKDVVMAIQGEEEVEEEEGGEEEEGLFKA
jgi:hypothetical protein